MERFEDDSLEEMSKSGTGGGVWSVVGFVLPWKKFGVII
jgi:hypothetical protein